MKSIKNEWTIEEYQYEVIVRIGKKMRMNLQSRNITTTKNRLPPLNVAVYNEKEQHITANMMSSIFFLAKRLCFF